jgi:hypothetical protein
MRTPEDLAPPFDPHAMAEGRRSAVAFSTESFRNAVVSAVNVVHITAQMIWRSLATKPAATRERSGVNDG